jgi:hypothetical protein
MGVDHPPPQSVVLLGSFGGKADRTACRAWCLEHGLATATLRHLPEGQHNFLRADGFGLSVMLKGRFGSYPETIEETHLLKTRPTFARKKKDKQKKQEKERK